MACPQYEQWEYKFNIGPGMFRNIYIEAYKNVIRENSNLEVMMCHVNHLYSAMGCILQDIEFMVANMLTSKQGPGSQASDKERMSMPQKMHNLTFNPPKIQFLPSSSIKCEYEPLPENSRSHGLRHHPNPKNDSLSKPDSFEEMFPKPRKQVPKQPEVKTTKAGSREASDGGRRKSNDPPDESQDDFMDFLFKKGK